MVLGVVSLILWALIIIVTLKYVVLVLRADNNGEGGTLSLVTLAQRALGHSTGVTIILGMVGRLAVLWRRHHHARRSRCSRRSRASSW